MAIAPPDPTTTRARGPRLEWDGKRGQVDHIELPFQLIETVNEPRQKDMFTAATAASAAATGWRNKLIWGDNKLVCASLSSEFEGKVDLIYIDPPFDTGQDFSFKVSVGDQEVTKLPSIIETKAYNDMWASLSSYLQMMYDRLVLCRGLLSERGSIYVHVGPNMNHLMRALLDEVFGLDQHRNEIIWKRTFAHSDAYIGSHYGQADSDGRKFRLVTLSAAGPGPARKFGDRMIAPPPGRHWAWGQERIDEGLATGRIVFAKTGQPNIKQYLDDTEGTVIQSVWDDLPPVNPISAELLGFPTQKPEALLERVINASAPDDGLVADFFCGSGTTMAVAEKLGRRWIGADLGRFAIHTSRKRLLDIPGCKPFEVLNLGKYERQYWQGVTTGRDDSAYIKLILELYRAQPSDDGTLVHGLKAGIAIHVGPIDAAVTVDEARDAVQAAQELGYKRLHVLGWEWQMGLKETAVDEALARGVQLSLKRIPSEIMDPRAREKGDVDFFEMNHVDATVDVRGRSVQVLLDDFIIADLELVKPEVQEKIERFSDYIDYWAVDFDYRDDTFHNQWQSFRTRKQPKLELESKVHTYDLSGPRDVLVKVIDIFGNDTTKLMKVNVE